jgi:hypothetical protein
VDSSRQSTIVFNVVWTGAVFDYLRFFVCSLMGQSEARFRFVANGCTDASIAAMERFAESHPDRVVEVFNACPGKMGAHGVALDVVHEQRDDGEFFSLVDPDIKARGPFLADFLDRLDGDCDAITSGRGVWCESDVVPPGHPGVAGEHFFRDDGFVYGSPHFAIYRRDALDETRARWGVQFRNAGPDVPDEARERLLAGGHDYRIFDTGKVLNILFQEDHRLCHYEHPELMHIGGMSHYLEPGAYVKRDGRDVPDWVRYESMASRFETARFTAEMLHALIERDPLPVIPSEIDPALQDRLVTVRDEMVDLVDRYRSC